MEQNFKNSVLRILIGMILWVMVESIYAIEPPVFSPNNTYTDWIDSTLCKFETQPGSNQRIFYTVDGTAPTTMATGSTKLYTNAGIKLGKTCIVRAISTQGNPQSQAISVEVSRKFTRVKAPVPVATFGPSLNFENAVMCTLSIINPVPSSHIRYSRNGVPVGLTSPIYEAPFRIDRTEQISFFGDATGYDPSAHVFLQFTKVEKLSMPLILTAEKTFSTPSLAVAVVCPPAAVQCRYSLDDAVTDLATQGSLLQGDTIRVRGNGDADTLTLRIQGFGSGNSASPINFKSYLYLAPVAEPTSRPSTNNPSVKIFYDSLTVQLSSTTPNALIRYTQDRSIPNINSNEATNGKPIQLFQSSTLKAIAFKEPQPPSSMATFEFLMRLTAPMADEPSQEYLESLVVQLSAKNPLAQIYYSLTGTAPYLANGQIIGGELYDKSRTLLINAPGTTQLKAIAVLEGIFSEVANYNYTKKQTITSHSQPIIDPPGQKFNDSLFIRLKTVDANAVVRYALSSLGTLGATPTPAWVVANPEVPIRIDSSAILTSQTLSLEGKSGLEPSPIRYDTFVITPSPPFSSPSPEKTYLGEVRVGLKCHTKGGYIHYTLDDDKSDPALSPGQRDSVIITLKSTSVIRALVRVGKEKSTVMLFQYRVITASPSDTLPPDSSKTFSSGIVLQNRSIHQVMASPHAFEELALKGFANPSIALQVKPVKPGAEINLTYSKPAGLPSALYWFGGSGRPEFVSADAKIPLTRPGEYFLAQDIQKPSITLVNQIPTYGDSTTVTFKITDNVAEPLCEISSPYLISGKVIAVPDVDGNLKVKIKGPEGTGKAIWLRVATRDFFNISRLPIDTLSKLYISQTLSLDKTPEVFNIGTGTGWELWDLAGLPVSNLAPLKWSDFLAANPGMRGVVWRDTGYALLEPNAILKPGMAWWLSNLKPQTALNLEKLRVGESDSAGRFAVTLRPGWNEVTSPSLERTYWPVTIELSQSGRSTVKAPYRFNRQWNELYRQTDILEPWVGYYVRYYGSKDTTIFVYSDPGQRLGTLSKVMADSSLVRPIDLEFGQVGAMPVRLGARTWAKDGFAAEDEPELPSWKARFGMAANRGRTALLTDLIEYKPGKVHHWRLIQKSAEPDETNIRLLVATLPAGYEAWAVSPSRSIKFRLEADQELPTKVGVDTLSIYAGPVGKLSSIPELAQSVLKVDAFFYTLERAAGQTLLRIDLPSAASLDIGVWSLSGQRLAHAHPGLQSMGTYRIRLNSQRDAQPAILRIQLRNKGVNQFYSRRVMW